MGDAAREHEALGLAARERREGAPGTPGEAERREERAGILLGVGPPRAPREEREGHVVERRAGGDAVRVLRHP